jgi:D-xylose transport system permease protein
MAEATEAIIKPTLPSRTWRVVARLRLTGTWAEALPLLLAIAVAVVAFRSASPFFLNAQNLTNLLGQLAPLELIAIASTVVIVMGEIDLSLGSIAGFTGALGALLLLHDAVPWWATIAATLGAGLAATALQGIVVVGGRVRSFAVTLAGFFIWYGIQLWILGANGQIVLRRQPVDQLASATIPQLVSLLVAGIGGAALIVAWIVLGLRERRDVDAGPRSIVVGSLCAFAVLGLLLWFITYLESGGGVPLIFGFVVAVTALVWILLTRTALGRHFYAVGGSAAAAKANGIAVARVKWIGFALAGALAAFAGITIASYTGGVDGSTGGGSLLLEGIGATVVGGVSLLGGRGSVWGAFGGAVLLEAVQNGLALLSLSFYVVYIVEGLVVLLALLADAAVRRRLVTT